jgi:hypothetical protein
MEGEAWAGIEVPPVRRTPWCVPGHTKASIRPQGDSHAPLRDHDHLEPVLTDEPGMCRVGSGQGVAPVLENPF